MTPVVRGSIAHAQSMTTDATQVTGSPHASDGPRPGDVLAERYELLEALDVDGASLGYRALDQETERQVLLRALAGPGLDGTTLADVLERLRGLVGVGGRFLSPLLDADREGRRPFTVESWPAGTQLSAIFQARRARGEPLGPREALPVAARLGAALAALPAPWHHGEVRAERVWVDTEGLRLTGAYLLAALPPAALADRMALLGPAAVAYPPELATGRMGAAADRWGVAAIVWEALTLRSPDRTHAPRELSASVLSSLRRLLDPEPARRPADLASVIDALARQAGLAAPRIDPEPHRPPSAAIGMPPSRAAPPRRLVGAPEPKPRAAARRVHGAAAEGTQEIAFDELVPEGASLPDDTAKHAAVPDPGDGLDPRLVRAALGITLESERRAPPSSDDALDPNLVRAALGVSIEEIVDEDSEEELDLEEARAPAAKPRAAPPSAGRSSAVREAAPVRAQSPARPAPIPKPRAMPAPAPARGAPAATRTPAPSTPPRAAPIPRAEPVERPLPARAPSPSPEPPRRAAQGDDGGTAIVARPPPEPPRPAPPRSSSASILIVVSAIVLALVIVALGFVVRSMLSQERDSAERTRHIQERLQQIRGEPGEQDP